MNAHTRVHTDTALAPCIAPPHAPQTVAPLMAAASLATARPQASPMILKGQGGATSSA
jgi:hypothetical protein